MTTKSAKMKIDLQFFTSKQKFNYRYALRSIFNCLNLFQEEVGAQTIFKKQKCVKQQGLQDVILEMLNQINLEYNHEINFEAYYNIEKLSNNISILIK